MGVDTRVSVDKRLGKRCFQHRYGLADVEERRRAAKCHGSNLILAQQPVNNILQDMLILVALSLELAEFLHEVVDLPAHDANLMWLRYG
jgi:hypothetical protein